MLAVSVPELLDEMDISSLFGGLTGLSGLAKGIAGISEQQANILSAAINTQNFYIIDIWNVLKKWDGIRIQGASIWEL